MFTTRTAVCALLLAAAGCGDKANPPAVAPDKPSMLPPKEGTDKPAGGKAAKGSDGLAKPTKDE